MSSVEETSKALAEYARRLGERARVAAREIRNLPRAARDGMLKDFARKLRESEAEIIAENQKDLDAGRKDGLSPAMLDRLKLDSKRIQGMAEAVKAIAALPDPVGRVLDEREREDGLKIRKLSVPIGTILFIYESRPNVTVDGGALCFKSGNAVILRGGKEAARTNGALARLFARSLKERGIGPDAIQLVEKPDRPLVDLLLADDAHIDLVIPRGGEQLIRTVAEKARMPVIKHYKGVCHVYVDKSADAAMAESIALNAKVQRPGVCNAMETLLLDQALPEARVRALLERFREEKVELRGDSAARRIAPDLKPASDSDWDEEYLDLVLAVKMVDGVRGAIEHINRHGTGHTEAVVAKSAAVQKAFLAGVDSASVMVNASTRLADGGEYGLGAEVGISTDKVHARGPMGLDSLTTYRWIVTGQGHVRA